jgi:hypothetical protein
VGTVKNYSGKLNQIVEFYEEHFPEELTEDGTLEAPLSTEPLLNFFSYIFIGAHERLKLDGPENISDKDPDPFSVSHIKGFRSAVVHLYTRKNMKLHPGYDKKPSGFRAILPYLLASLWLWAQYQWADCSTHMVPEGWRLPTQVPVKAAYDWWFHGDKATGIQPYCNLKRADISSADVMRLTRMRRVITELCLRMDLPEGITSPSQLTIVDSDSCFTAAYDKLMADVLQVTNIKRPNDWSYGSAYNAILKLKKLLF